MMPNKKTYTIAGECQVLVLVLLGTAVTCDTEDINDSDIVPSLDAGDETPTTWADRAAAMACEVQRTQAVESIDLSGPEADVQLWGYYPDADTWAEAAHVRIILPDRNPKLKPPNLSWIPIDVNSKIGWEHTYMLMSDPGNIRFFGSNEVSPGVAGAPEIKAIAHDASKICPGLPYGWYIEPHQDTVNPTSLLTGFNAESSEVEIVLVHPERP